jgi:outer membrane immunogenic protein
MLRNISLFILIELCFGAMSAQAHAADIYDWTGFYLGAEGGYGWGRMFSKSLDNGSTANPSMNGGAGGPFAGFNYQFANRIVLGIETEASFGNIEGDTDCPNKAFSCFGRVDWVGSTRARGGYAFDKLLPYVTFGVAYGQATIGQSPKGSNNESVKARTHVGWSPGAGFEFAVTRHFIARVAYAYYHLGNRRVTDDFDEHLRYRLSVHQIQLGLGIKFD